MAKGSLPFGNERGGSSGAETGRDVTDEFVVPASAPWTVSALVARIKEALLEAFPLQLAVVGEISNFKRHSSGHLYFSLKDEAAAIDAVMFRPQAASVRFEIADGLEVVAEGRVDLYDRQGRLQLYVQRLIPKGTGALELAFRQLKERLEREGLFDPAGKKPLARFPRAVGVITSPTGAAIRDVARTLSRRWPAARVYLVPVRVQGESAAGEIAEAIRLLDASAQRLQIDTIIVGRGGGSLEDLWAFNEEPVARAIFAARTPIISAVGHEVDFTIADFVADVRAATPTAATELAVPDRAEIGRTVQVLSGRLARRVGELLEAARNALGAVQRSVVFRDPTAGVRSVMQRLDELASRMRHGLAEHRSACQRRLHEADRALAALHPMHLHERAAALLERVWRDLAWALGRRAKHAGDLLAQRAKWLAKAHPRSRLELARQRVSALGRQLEAMSYREVLKRGFSVTRQAEGEILRSARQAGSGDWLETELIDGRVRSQVGGTTGGAEAATAGGKERRDAPSRPPGGPARPRRKPDNRTPTLFDTR